MQTSNTHERRSSQRQVQYNEVIATNTVGNVSALLGINYSKSGIALISYTPIEVGEILGLEFTIKDNNGSSQHRLTAEVVQNFDVCEIYVLGLRFQEELEQPTQSRAS